MLDPVPVTTNEEEQRGGKGKRRNGAPMSPERIEEEQSVAEWLRQLAPGGQVKVRVMRVEANPRFVDGRKMTGILGWHNEMISDEMISDLYGGGTFKLMVQTPNDKGQYIIRAHRTIEIVGKPKMPPGSEPDDEEEGVKATPAAVEPDIVRHAMNMQERAAQEERRRAERLEQALHERPSGPDMSFVETIVAPMRDQARELREELREERRLAAAREEKFLEAQKREDPVQSRLLEKMIEGEGARIAAIREQHETELRVLREHAREDVKRVEDRFSALTQSQERAHERELAGLKQSYESQLRNQEMVYSSQTKQLEHQAGLLQADLVATKTELAALRAQKETPLEDQVQRLNALKELLGSSDEAKEDPAWLQALGAVMGSDLVKSVGARIASGPADVPATQQQAAAVAEQRRRLAIMARRRALAQRAQSQAQPQPQAAPQAEVAPATPPAPKVQVDPKELALAIPFIEQAIRNDTDPAEFAQTVRAMVPGPVISALLVDGVDGLLGQIQLDAGSPLTSQLGQNFMGKVVKALASHVA